MPNEINPPPQVMDAINFALKEGVAVSLLRNLEHVGEELRADMLVIAENQFTLHVGGASKNGHYLVTVGASTEEGGDMTAVMLLTVDDARHLQQTLGDALTKLEEHEAANQAAAE